jgi:uncharacterized membrane protein YeaQ/YmgE (transglycosylase-associated protein family)
MSQPDKTALLVTNNRSGLFNSPILGFVGAGLGRSLAIFTNNL